MFTYAKLSWDTSVINWGAWFGDFKTAGAARRYLTMNWTGPRVTDADAWHAEVREHEGVWQVRLGQHPLVETP